MTYPNADDVKWMKWYATTEDVRADDWEWDKWLAEYTRQQREEAWNEALKYVQDLSDPAHTIVIFPDRELITLGDVYQAQDDNPYRAES